MKEGLELKDFLSTNKGIRILLSIENKRLRFTDLYQDIANLSPSTLNKYLNQMLDLGIIKLIGYKGKARGERKKRVYQLTEEGKELIEPIKNICFAKQKIGEIIETLSNKG